ncbi:hypothetical protein B1H26_33110 [Amycolatopsis sp. BJA-103]|nr:hypothetical protein BKN51_09000 [Amycolatopsis sp. BJA-103]PNE14792.1 hypothetical protein B1H26_33110 [Amycolatopsis sp. BJA-103]
MVALRSVDQQFRDALFERADDQSLRGPSVEVGVAVIVEADVAVGAFVAVVRPIKPQKLRAGFCPLDMVTTLRRLRGLVHR